MNKKIRLRTEGSFDAAHYLKGYDGKCSRLHGHTWRIIVWVEGEQKQLDKIGMLWDFTNLKAITNKLDHYNLNEVLAPHNPTAENLCLWIYDEIIQMEIFDKEEDKGELKFKVRVYESPKSYCEVGDW